MKINNYVGIDVSKNTLDFCVIKDGKKQCSITIENAPKQIKHLINQLIKKHGGNAKDFIFCMEYTGIYNMFLLEHLQSIGALIWLESGIHIKRSLGMVRGKNDKVDAFRIAMFAFTNRHDIKLWIPPRDIIKNLRALLAQRIRLVKAKHQLMIPVKEQKIFTEKKLIKKLEQNIHPVLKIIQKQLKEIEIEIFKLIKEDNKLNELYQKITSIKGLSLVTAAHIIATTNEFIGISNAKKFACYAGVVPFEHTSGTSIRGRSRVSQMANKHIKTLLHMSALVGIRHNEEFKEYYERRIKEGKNKMSVINMIRNKIILRIYACVRENRLYEKNYQHRLHIT